MCGRFAQAQTREEYLAYLADEAERERPPASKKSGPFQYRQNQTAKNTLLILTVHALMKRSVRCTSERKHFSGNPHSQVLSLILLILSLYV